MNTSVGNYSVEVDTIDEQRWGELVLEFDDATIHQTWAMGAISFGANNLSHLVQRRDGEVIGMAQVSIKKLPIVGVGIARAFWGPLWRRKGRPMDYAILDKMVDALKNEYVTKRGLLLRVWPVGFPDSEDRTISILGKYGFVRNRRVRPYRTLLLDLAPSLEEVRKNLAQKWRNQLNVAERGNLTLMEGESDDMFLTFLKLLNETRLRKGFTSGVDCDLYRRIQSDLPKHSKMKIYVCASDGEPVSAGVFSAVGETGEYLLGATSNNGLRFNGSNLIHWSVIKWLKERGCRWYDLGGVDPSGNHGVYHFKCGIAGKNGKEVTHSGQFYLSTNPANLFLNACIDRSYHARKKLRGALDAILPK